MTRDMVSVMWKILAGTVWTACASKHNPAVPRRNLVLRLSTLPLSGVFPLQEWGSYRLVFAMGQTKVSQ
jgi:hypothetical protein